MTFKEDLFETEEFITFRAIEYDQYKGSLNSNAFEERVRQLYKYKLSIKYPF